MYLQYVSCCYFWQVNLLKTNWCNFLVQWPQGFLQSQGRILRKMRFMPSSLTSNSHRLLTALVDSRHKKVYKVKNCITDIDPEREKEEKEKVIGWAVDSFLLLWIKFLFDLSVSQAANQSIRANLLLNRKKEKVNKKYAPAVDRRRQLSPGFLEDALDEVCCFGTCYFF